jgi:hypothetical protein
LDPLQRRPHRGRWPDIEVDDLASMLPPPGPASPTVVTVPAEGTAIPWPVQSTTQLVRHLETIVGGQAAVPGDRKRPGQFREGTAAYRPFARREE